MCMHISTTHPQKTENLSCSIKIHALGFDKLLESIFCILLVVESFCKLLRCLKKWQSVV